MNSSRLSNTMRNSILTKAFTIGFLIFLLLIPLFMIWLTIEEREHRFDDAKYEVSSKWGREQTIVGPIVSIPYEVARTTIKGTFNLLPENLTVDSTVTPEVRKRGIFEVPLYKLGLKIDADFKAPDLSEYNFGPNDLKWNEATVYIGTSDMRGIQENLEFSWGEQVVSVSPAPEIPAGVPHTSRAGLQGIVPSALPAEGLHFAMEFALNGSENLSIAPVGKETSVHMSSSWANPSFMGAFLPEDHTITDEGFDANWKVSYFNRSFPQQWLRTDYNSDIEYNIQQSLIGVELLMPVDFYQQTTRSAKYAILFILMTFTVFFLFEILNKLRIHPLQYLMVGFAMCLFYLLLLSFSEHIGFGNAYLVSSISTIGLISAYCSKILNKKSRALIMTLLLTAIYVYLYILLQMEDYALLIGSVSLFSFLAAVMYLTRNIDWYASRDGAPKEIE